MTHIQKIRQTEMMLNDLIHCEQPLAIPGNFRAKQRRTKHDESTQVFPIPKRKDGQENFKTHYNYHFKSKKEARPSSPRPCSPTRRNNPHPSKNFLNWRIPTRVFDYGKGKAANVSFLKSNVCDTYQSFYDDYTGRKTGKSDEVDPKLLLEIAKSYSSPTQKKNRKFLTSYDLSKFDMQKKGGELSLPNVLRHSWSPDQSASGQRKPKKGREILSPLFTKPEFRPLFQSWYDAASDKEKDEPKSTLEEEENAYLEQALTTALKPDAIQAIEQWLMDANEEEREIAMQFIKAIILASVNDTEDKTSDNDPPQKPTVLPLGGGSGGANYSRQQRSPIHHHHTTTKACDVCQKQNLQAALQQLQAVATMPMEVPGITELLNPLHPAVVKEKNTRRLQPMGNRKLNRPRRQATSNANNGSLFVTSKKQRAKHFTIHPEWF